MTEQGIGIFESIPKTPDTADARAVESTLEVLDEMDSKTIFNILFRDYIEEKKQ